MAEAGPLDRELQRALLLEMQSVYPSVILDFESGEDREAALIANLAYLDGHGLCSAKLMHTSGGIYMDGAVITARGLDFLADDGGLSAILGVVTVKLHADTIRDLIEAKIDASAATPEQKKGLKAHLKRLSAAALQAAAKDLMTKGLDHLPDAIGWLHTLGIPG